MNFRVPTPVIDIDAEFRHGPTRVIGFFVNQRRRFTIGLLAIITAMTTQSGHGDRQQSGHRPTTNLHSHPCPTVIEPLDESMSRVDISKKTHREPGRASFRKYSTPAAVNLSVFVATPLP
ncbi:MAG: hypothetical protein CMJ65_06850 [Planctomycetaceae bacterium]|nr:hypothetical protein [Planctomycetaceae bacterium]